MWYSRLLMQSDAAGRPIAAPMVIRMAMKEHIIKTFTDVARIEKAYRYRTILVHDLSRRSPRRRS